MRELLNRVKNKLCYNTIYRLRLSRVWHVWLCLRLQASHARFISRAYFVRGLLNRVKNRLCYKTIYRLHLSRVWQIWLFDDDRLECRCRKWVKCEERRAVVVEVVVNRCLMCCRKKDSFDQYWELVSTNPHRTSNARWWEREEDEEEEEEEGREEEEALIVIWAKVKHLSNLSND